MTDQRPGAARPSPAKRTSRLTLSPTGARVVRALALILVGMIVTISSAASDAYLHRGTSEETGVIYRLPTDRGLATNVELRNMSDNELSSAVNFLGTGGFQYARQEFVWSEIEPTPGEFEWTDYQRIVTALTTAGIQVVVVIVGTPNWARAPDQLAYTDAPPLLPDYLESFCRELHRQFPELQMFQIGKNLDDSAYWGGKRLLAATYRNLLQSAGRGLEVGGTGSFLVAGEVGANAQLRATGADIATLQEMVSDPSIRGLVSVFAVNVDGGVRSPYDRRASVSVSSLSRVVLVREAIDDAGAIDVPLWFTHFGWTGNGDGSVSLENQADFVESGMRRAREEWPWVGLIFNWTYAALPDEPNSAPMALITNGNPTPLMLAMGDFSRSAIGSSMTSGFAPADASPCVYTGNWQDQHLPNGLYRTVRDPEASVTCRFWGTGISTFMRFSPDAGTANFTIDADENSDSAGQDISGSVILTYRVSDAFELPVVLAEGLDEGAHTVTIRLAGSGELVIGGFLVERERPMIWPIAVLVAAGLVALFLGLRNIAYLAAEQVGMLSRDGNTSTSPELPTMPGWKPTPRLGKSR